MTLGSVFLPGQRVVLQLSFVALLVCLLCPCCRTQLLMGPIAHIFDCFLEVVSVAKCPAQPMQQCLPHLGWLFHLS